MLLENIHNFTKYRSFGSDNVGAQLSCTLSVTQGKRFIPYPLTSGMQVDVEEYIKNKHPSIIGIDYYKKDPYFIPTAISVCERTLGTLQKDKKELDKYKWLIPKKGPVLINVVSDYPQFQIHLGEMETVCNTPVNMLYKMVQYVDLYLILKDANGNEILCEDLSTPPKIEFAYLPPCDRNILYNKPFVLDPTTYLD